MPGRNWPPNWNLIVNAALGLKSLETPDLDHLDLDLESLDLYDLESLDLDDLEYLDLDDLEYLDLEYLDLES